MFNSKTVIILGAGASYEVGFPLGSGLRTIISNKLNFQLDSFGRPMNSGDNRIFNLLNKFDGDSDRYFQACKHIRDGIILSDSIDDFIDSHRDNAYIKTSGKLAIAAAILDSEKKCDLFVNQSNIYNTINFGTVENTWYSKFFRLLTKQLPTTELNNVFDNVKIVNFNYDRSLEQFLIYAFVTRYNITKDEAKLLLKKLTIYRPYGSVGNDVEFASDTIPPLDKLVKTLRTYTEQVQDKSGLEEVRHAILDAEVLIFLGMAYHPNNLKLLQVSNNTVTKKIYATREGIFDQELHIIRKKISNMLYSENSSAINKSMLKMFEENNIFFTHKCSQLFTEYNHTLSEHYISA